MSKIKRVTAGVIAGAAVLAGLGTVAAGAANAETCQYHSRVMFGNYIFDGYGGGPQQATQDAWRKAKAQGRTGAPYKLMWTQFECR
ncbi:hypothetical protein FK529_09200 [Tsukamurella asaccharolytica]|uniref:DUF4189 domain-containing protein n=1 Tax=Tsukamurella asaccharolytica TaxID=2592067 RepID=A0A5C5RB73_9ACTN|nr:hypothetical protein [Tsukamurella asaccharolytica]TWS19371.1 hypothetical protein FK529_09200 [Tsukamurella asaccharolytica]